MTTVVTGYKGRLGSELVKNWNCLPFEADVTNEHQVKAAMNTLVPDVIINCAALTDVDKAEDEYPKYFDVNAKSVNNFVPYINDGVKFIQISSDHVFSGTDGPYKEVFSVTEKTKALSVNAYGWSKLGAEIFLQDVPNVTIVRTTGLYGSGPDLDDFAKYFIRELKSAKNLVMVTNKYKSNHTYIPHLAHGLNVLATKLMNGVKAPIVHIASDDIMSRYEFILKMAEVFGLEKAKIEPIGDVKSWIAKRPTKGGLKCGYAKAINVPIYSTEQGLKAFKEVYHV